MFHLLPPSFFLFLLHFSVVLVILKCLFCFLFLFRLRLSFVLVFVPLPRFFVLVFCFPDISLVFLSCSLSRLLPLRSRCPLKLLQLRDPGQRTWSCKTAGRDWGWTDPRWVTIAAKIITLADVSIFFIFFRSGRGQGQSEALGRRVRFFIENPRRGGTAANWGIGGGLNILFRGRNVH